MRALLALALALALCCVGFRAGPAAALCKAARWPLLRPSAAPLRAIQAGGGGTAPHSSFTIVISTFKRDSSLVENVGHWLTCGPAVHSVQVIWHDPSREPPPSGATCAQFRPRFAHVSLTFRSRFAHVVLTVVAMAGDPRVQIVRQRDNKLTNRFRIDFGAAADAVVSSPHPILTSSSPHPHLILTSSSPHLVTVHGGR